MSINNIILIDLKEMGGLSRMLIDFDLIVTIHEGGKNERTDEHDRHSRIHRHRDPQRSFEKRYIKH